MIDTIILWSNGLVTVFDDNGDQITRLQGRFLEKRDLIKQEDISRASYYIGSWDIGKMSITKEQFFSDTWERKETK